MAKSKKTAKPSLTCIVSNQTTIPLPIRNVESSLREVEEISALFKMMHPELTAHMLRMARSLVVQFPARTAPQLRLIGNQCNA
jgi:hypothetical protein